MLMAILYNPIFQTTLTAVIIAQILKAILDYWRLKHFHWQSLFRGAGMPSSHTATVAALTLSVIIVEGINTLSIVTFVFASIVIRDVIGDKIFAVHQEKKINIIIQQLLRQEKVEWTHLIGHTITEVIAGMILGVLVTITIFYGL